MGIINKDVQMKIKNGLDWEFLFPKTKANLVKMGDESLDTVIKGLSKDLESKITPEQVDAKVSQAISKIIADAPQQLDTIKEIATALKNDSHIVDTILNKVNSKVGVIKSDGDGVIDVDGKKITVCKPIVIPPDTSSTDRNIESIKALVNNVKLDLTNHKADKVSHVTQDEKNLWGSKADKKHYHSFSDISNATYEVFNSLENDKYVEFTYNPKTNKTNAKILLSDRAEVATKLATAIKINGVVFDGTKDITIRTGAKIVLGKTEPVDAEEGSVWYEEL